MRYEDIHGQFRSKFKIYRNYLRLAFANRMPPGKFKNRVVRGMGVDMKEGVFISPGVILDPIFPEFIHLGRNVVLGWNARIFSHIVTPYHRDTMLKFMDMEKEGRIKVLKTVSSDDGKYQLILAAGEIWIGDGAFVGGFTTVRAGVKIGEGAIVGSDSLVTKDIPPWKIAIGKPVRVVGDVKQEAI